MFGLDFSSVGGTGQVRTEARSVVVVVVARRQASDFVAAEASGFVAAEASDFVAAEAG